MGFLKRLPSFSKRNRNKIAERSPAPTALDPLKENVKPDLPLNVTPLDADANMNDKSTNSNTTLSTTELGLFDDIFTELNQTSSSHDSLQADISLSFALSQQLQLDSTQNQQQKSLSSSTKANTPATLFGQDSIYSSYVNKPHQADTTHSSSSSNAGVAPSTSLSPSPSYTNAPGPEDDEKTKEQGATTQMVLDSDISGSDDDDDDDDEEAGSEEEVWGNQQQLKGACPIMERRTNDHRCNANRSNVLVESNQTMLNRMKNRHRQQVKLQNSRPQTPGMMRPTSPMVYAAPPSPASAMVVPLHHLQRNSPMAATPLTRSSSASSAYRHHASPWISDYTPSRPSPLAPNRSLRLRPTATSNTATSSTSLRSTMSQEDDHDLTRTTGDCSDDSEDADDEADHDDDNATLQRHRPVTTNSSKKHMPSIHHSCSVPDFKNRKRQDTYSPPSFSQTSISDQHSTVSLSSSSSASTTTTTTTTSPTQRHLFSSIQRQEGMHRMRTMTSEPDLKQLASHPAPMHGYHQLFFHQQQQQFQLQQQRQRMQLEWEMMQLYQREQQLKQEYMLLQQRSYSIHKSSTLPSLSTAAHQDPRFYYPSSSSLGPGLY